MKKIYLVFGAALVIITLCMVFLAVKGISLRSEPIIKPSVVDAQYQNITYAVIHRLFPEFQKTDYVVWGINPDVQTEEGTLFQLLQKAHQAQMGVKPQWIHWTEQTSVDELKKCVKPCWITMEKEQANSLKKNDSLNKIQSVLGLNYFSVTFLEFDRAVMVPAVCETEQRLDFSCLQSIAVREVRKYFKRNDIRYFFSRAYNEIDYFLFIEKAK